MKEVIKPLISVVASGTPGSFDFKKNWGFEPQPLHYEYQLYGAEAVPDHNPLNPKYQLFIKAWRKLPLPLANLIGPHIVKNLG